MTTVGSPATVLSFTAIPVPSAGSVPSGVRLTDLDNDGHPDILMLNTSAAGGAVPGVAVAMNQGCFVFAPAQNHATTDTSPTQLTVGDADGDGLTDVIVGGPTITNVFTNEGGGVLARVASSTVINSNQVWSHDLLDVDGDGHPDLVVLPLGSSTISLFAGLGNDKFAATPTALFMVANVSPPRFYDLDGDGRLDFLSAEQNRVVTAISGPKAPGAPQTTTSIDTMYNNTDAQAADFDGDGIKDLVVVAGVAHNIGRIWFAKGNGDGTFGAAQYVAAIPDLGFLVVGDFDGDHHLDVALVATAAAHFFTGNGDGTFTADRMITLASPPTAVDVGDLDGDGKADLLLGGSANSATVLRNTSH
jgi:FG-GAP-like repeat